MKSSIIFLFVFLLTITPAFAVVELTWEDLEDGAITLSDFGMPEDETWGPVTCGGTVLDDKINIEETTPPEGDFTKLPDGGWYIEFTLPEFDDSKAIKPDYYDLMFPSILSENLLSTNPGPLLFDIYVNDENKIECISTRAKPCDSFSHNALNWGANNRLELRNPTKDCYFYRTSSSDRVLSSSGIYGIASILEIKDFSIDKGVMKVGETAKIKVEVENIGGITQRANLHLASAYGSCIRPQSQSLSLKPGESKEIEFRLTAMGEGTYPSIVMLSWCDTSDCQDEMEVDELIAVEMANQKPASCDGYEVQKKEVADEVTLRQQNHDIEAFTGLAKYSYGREEILDSIHGYLDDISPIIGVVDRIYSMGALK